MRRLLIRLLRNPILKLANKYTSNPDRTRIFDALSDLHIKILDGDKERGLVVPFDINTGKFIIFSDQHKGARNGADDFLICEENYLSALDYYHQNGFTFIDLGDSEELWENLLGFIKKAHKPSFEKEKQFIARNAFIKIYGNHDLFWDNDPFAALQLKDIFGVEVPIYEGVVLQTRSGDNEINILCTHGHQGDKVSDGNWFSKFFIARVWAPLQGYLKINPNTPAYDAALKTQHNTIMYEWSRQQKDLLLITGHTHQPVFESLTHLERLYRQLLFARQIEDEGMMNSIEEEIVKRKFQITDVSEDYLTMKPSYFNTGCCCFDDGDITGLELSDGILRLIEWKKKEGKPERIILEEAPLIEIFEGIRKNKPLS